MVNRNGALEKQGKIVEKFGGKAGARMLVIVVGELGENITLGHESSRNESDQAGAGVEDVDDSPEIHFVFLSCVRPQPFVFYIDSIAHQM